MKKMTYFFTLGLLLFSILGLSNCGTAEEEKDATNYYIKFDLNGKSYSYEKGVDSTADAYIFFDANNDIEICAALKQLDKEFQLTDPSLAFITIENTSELELNAEYSGYTVINIAIGKNQTVAPHFNSVLDLNGDSLVILTITNITDSFIEGTFKGRVEDFSENDLGILEVTNGSFRLKKYYE